MGEIFAYRETDGCTIEGILHRTDSKNAPLLVYIHGGGLIWGSKEDMNSEQIRRYTEAGFHVFSVDYRLAPESKLPAIRDDLETLFRWIREEAPALFDFDPGKVAAVGNSAGGYLSLLAGTCEHQPAAIVSFYGYGQVTGDWYKKPSPYFTAMPAVPKALADQLVKPTPISAAPIQSRYAIYLYCRQTGAWLDYVAGDSLAGDAAALQQYAPLELADNSYPDTLLIHGDADDDVPYEESAAMKEKLDSLGVYSELMTIRGGKHNFDANMEDPDAVRAVERTIAFLKDRFSMN